MPLATTSSKPLGRAGFRADGRGGGRAGTVGAPLVDQPGGGVGHHQLRLGVVEREHVGRRIEREEAAVVHAAFRHLRQRNKRVVESRQGPELLVFACSLCCFSAQKKGLISYKCMDNPIPLC